MEQVRLTLVTHQLQENFCATRYTVKHPIIPKHMGIPSGDSFSSKRIKSLAKRNGILYIQNLSVPPSSTPAHFMFNNYSLGSLRYLIRWSSDQIRSVAQSCLTLCHPMNRSPPGLPVHYQLPEFTQTHVHQVSDAIQPSHPLSSPSPLAPNPSQHQSLFQWVNSSHEVAKVLEFQL